MYLSNKIESIVIKNTTQDIVLITPDHIQTTKGYEVNVKWRYEGSGIKIQYLCSDEHLYSITVTDVDGNHVVVIAQDNITTAPCYTTIVNYKKVEEEDEHILDPYFKGRMVERNLYDCIRRTCGADGSQCGYSPEVMWGGI